MNWNQPCCAMCWTELNPDRKPYSILPEYAEWETCSWCGIETRSGIYIRHDPADVPFPAAETVD